jgi:hypothetical protein
LAIIGGKGGGCQKLERLRSALGNHWQPPWLPIIANEIRETSFDIARFYFLDQINTLERKVEVSYEGISDGPECFL